MLRIFSSILLGKCFVGAIVTWTKWNSSLIITVLMLLSATHSIQTRVSVAGYNNNTSLRGEQIGSFGSDGEVPSSLMERIELCFPAWQARMITIIQTLTNYYPFAFCRLIYRRWLLWCVRLGRLDARGRRWCANWLRTAALGQGSTTCNGNGAQLC